MSAAGMVNSQNFRALKTNSISISISACEPSRLGLTLAAANGDVKSAFVLWQRGGQQVGGLISWAYLKG